MFPLNSDGFSAFNGIFILCVHRLNVVQAWRIVSRRASVEFCNTDVAVSHFT